MPFTTDTPRSEDVGSDSDDEGKVCLKISAPSGSFSINMYQSELDSMTVMALKEVLSPRLEWPPDKIMLAYSGKMLNNSSQLSSLGISDGSKMMASRELGDRATTSDTLRSNSGYPQSRDDYFSSLLGSGNGSGNNVAGFHFHPGLIDSILDNQTIGSALQSPDFIRSLLTRGSKINKMIEQNQDLMQILNDSELLLQISDTFKNPKLIQEVMRNNDRQLSNVESLPGGLNILSKLYQNLQETSNLGVFDKSTDSLNDEFARNLGVKKRQLNEINDEPLPNPWVPGKNLEDRGMNNLSRRLFTLKDEVDPLIGYDDPGLIFMKPTDDNMHASGTPNSFLGMLQMLADMSSPVSSSKANSPKALRNSSSGQSSLRVSKPKGTELSSPSTIKSAESFSQPKLSPPSDPPKKLEDLDINVESPSSKSTSHDEVPVMPSTSQRQQPQGDVSAEERYALEIRLLMEMGFSKKEECISALLAAGGNIEGALAYLRCITFPQRDGKN